jgi:hypothetical protein
MFSYDFGDDMPRLANLVDIHGNQFEILVDKADGNLYVTRG